MKGVRINTESFKINSRKVHQELNSEGNFRYIYDYVNYINPKIPVAIYCTEKFDDGTPHGIFYRTYHEHVHCKYGCPICGKISNIKKHTKDTNWFINKAREIHGNFYNYDESKYVKNNIPLKIICPFHGEFFQEPRAHLSGQGCSDCGKLKTIGSHILGLKELEKRSKELYRDYYIFSESEYNGQNNDIKIICPIHGEFITTPYKHMYNSTGICPECLKIKLTNDFHKYKKDYIEKARKIHTETNQWGNPKYEYHKIIEPFNLNTDIWIHCTEEDENGLVHGDFPQTAGNHLQGKGCPICAKKFDLKESELKNYIKSLNINFQENNRKIISKELDIYIPEKNLAIEFNGTFWHSEKYKDDKKYHYWKSLECGKQNIHLIHVWEHLWNNSNKQDVIKSIIKQYLGLNQNINSDDYILKLIDLNNCFESEKQKIQIFFDNNSIDEYIDSEYCLLLEYNGVIYQASLWSKILDYWELQSLTNKNNYNIIGGFNKLLNYFVQEFKPNQILYKLDYNYFDKHIFNELDIKPEYKGHIEDYFNFDEIYKRKKLTGIKIYNSGFNIFLWNNFT